jgi:hypothetical protein
MSRKLRLIVVLILTVIVGLAVSVRAGERAISINGDGNAVWFVTGEPTLVMNGFDLDAFGAARPGFIDRVSIAVDTAVAGSTVEVVIYEDANGGAPTDATLIGRASVQINQTGVFTAVLPNPVQVNQRAIWVGFYLPVGFRFLADTSGPSVLTYWAWTPGGTFDLSRLADAAVIGPSDGTAPVNINMNGKARISFEISATAAGAAATPLPGISAAATVQPGPAGGDLSVLAQFPNCAAVLYDTADEFITYGNDFDAYCTTVADFQAPPSPLGYDRRGGLYDVYFYRTGGQIQAGRLEFPFTVCLRPDAVDINTAVIGVAWGGPRRWRIQPTLRFGDLVCADVRRAGNFSYFVPNGQPTATPVPN